MNRRQRLIRGGAILSVIITIATIFVAGGFGDDVTYDTSPTETFFLLWGGFMVILWVAIWFCVTFLKEFQPSGGEGD